MLIKHYVIAAAGALLLNLAGCEEQGPAEEAGEEIDQMVEEGREGAGEAAEEAAEKLEEATDKLREKAE
ncbi:MAG: hypothetical protein U5S82_02890 [Gammaproteobacteria bacterium]|nr:hypothetical protein [Gammaproteobacteria bacterium]